MEVWHFDATRNGVKVLHIIYGHVPDGYKETVPAKPLTPGCYDVGFGEGGNKFDVKTDSSIVGREH
jgi:hypothetical protein